MLVYPLMVGPTEIRMFGRIAALVSFSAAAAAAETAADLRSAGNAVAERLIADARSSAPVTYMGELGVEGLLEFARATDQPAYLERIREIVLPARQLEPATIVPWKKQPFGCLTYALYAATGERGWLPVFQEQSELMRKEIWRDSTGIILHPRGTKRGGGEAMLIDAAQEYCSRSARMGALTGDPSWFAECSRQFREYRKVLRDPATGLYSQGRGWISGKPAELSPGAWSRGHGWLMRGMEQSLRVLPRESAEYLEIRGYFIEIADALLKVQRPDGMWPCLLQRPAAESPPETSGTAMIAWHLARAIRDGHLTDSKYRKSARRAFAALPAYVLADGTVLNTSPGPGPLESEIPWLVSAYPPGDPHGSFAILHAAAGEALLGR